MAIEDANEEFRVFCGIDWATQTHQVCVLDSHRQLVEQRSVAHDGESLGTLVAWLVGLAEGAAERVAVGIEVPHGAVVETLIEAGIAVFAINPKQLDRLRDRHTVAGAKDDRRDAFVLADGVAGDRHLFRRVQLDPPQILELRAAGRLHDQLREQINMASNRLREQLLRFFPQVLALGATTESWLWDLVELVGTPERARRLRRTQVTRLLAQHRIRRLNADAVLAELRKPALHVAPGVPDAAGLHVTALIEQLRLLDRQRKRCDARARAILTSLSTAEPTPSGAHEEAEPGQQVPSREPCDVAILRSLPGVGDYVVATVLAEASQALGAREYDTLRALAGVAPVTKRSGKSLLVVRRRASNPRLVDAMHFWGLGALRGDQTAKRHYRQLRSKGHSHARAVRGIVDRLLAVACAMLRNRTLYDPSQRRTCPVPQPSNGAYPAPMLAT